MRLRATFIAVASAVVAVLLGACGDDGGAAMAFGKIAATMQPCSDDLHVEVTEPADRWAGATEQASVRCGQADISDVIVATYPTAADARRGLDRAPRRIQAVCQVDRHLVLSLVTANAPTDREQSLAEESLVQRRLDREFCTRAGGRRIVRTGSRARAARRAAAEPRVAFVGRPHVLVRRAAGRNARRRTSSCSVRSGRSRGRLRTTAWDG